MTLSELLEKQAALAKEHEEVTQKAERLRVKVRELESQVRETRKEILSLERERIRLSEEHNALNPKIDSIEKEIERKKENEAVQVLLKESETFEAALSRAIEVAQKPYEGLVELLSPAVAAKRVVQDIENLPPSHELVLLQRGLRDYTKGLETLCLEQVRGRAPTPQCVLELHERVLAFAKTPLVTSYWYGQ